MLAGLRLVTEVACKLLKANAERPEQGSQDDGMHALAEHHDAHLHPIAEQDDVIGATDSGFQTDVA